MHELEKRGVPAICKANNIQPDELGVKGCLLIYRRREQDMPLAQAPDNATPEQIASHPHPFYTLIATLGDRYTMEPVAYELKFASAPCGATLVKVDLTQEHCHKVWMTSTRLWRCTR